MAETQLTNQPAALDTYCPNCNHNATRATLLGRAARMFCYCQPCGLTWWAA